MLSDCKLAGRRIVQMKGWTWTKGEWCESKVCGTSRLRRIAQWRVIVARNKSERRHTQGRACRPMFFSCTPWPKAARPVDACSSLKRLAVCTADQDVRWCPGTYAAFQPANGRSLHELIGDRGTDKLCLGIGPWNPVLAQKSYRQRCRCGLRHCVGHLEQRSTFFKLSPHQESTAERMYTTTPNSGSLRQLLALIHTRFIASSSSGKIAAEHMEVRF